MATYLSLQVMLDIIGHQNIASLLVPYIVTLESFLMPIVATQTQTNLKVYCFVTLAADTNMVPSREW